MLFNFHRFFFRLCAQSIDLANSPEFAEKQIYSKLQAMLTLSRVELIDFAQRVNSIFLFFHFLLECHLHTHNARFVMQYSARQQMLNDVKSNLIALFVDVSETATSKDKEFASATLTAQSESDDICKQPKNPQLIGNGLGCCWLVMYPLTYSKSSDWASATQQMRQFFECEEALEHASHARALWSGGARNYKAKLDGYVRGVIDAQHARSVKVLEAVQVARQLVEVCFEKLQVLLKQQIDSVADKLALFRKTVASTWLDFFVESCVAQTSLNLQNDDAKMRLAGYALFSSSSCLSFFFWTRANCLVGFFAACKPNIEDKPLFGTSSGAKSCKLK